MSKTALAVIPEQKFELVDISQMGTSFAEEMDGLILEFDKVKVPSGGGTAFEIPSDDPDNPEVSKELVGVIVDHYPVNAYWAKTYDGSKNAPDCSAMDGKIGIPRPDSGMPGGPCAQCHLNQWGSAIDKDGNSTKGKACKNIHRVFVLPEGAMLPMLFSVPPTSLKNMSDFVAKRVLAKGRTVNSVITKITLKKEKNAGGIDYSQAQFAVVGILDAETRQKMAQFSASIKPATRNVTIEMDDYNTQETSEQAQGRDLYPEEKPF